MRATSLLLLVSVAAAARAVVATTAAALQSSNKGEPWRGSKSAEQSSHWVTTNLTSNLYRNVIFKKMPGQSRTSHASHPPDNIAEHDRIRKSLRIANSSTKNHQHPHHRQHHHQYLKSLYQNAKHRMELIDHINYSHEPIKGMQQHYKNGHKHHKTNKYSKNKHDVYNFGQQSYSNKRLDYKNKYIANEAQEYNDPQHASNNKVNGVYLMQSHLHDLMSDSSRSFHHGAGSKENKSEAHTRGSSKSPSVLEQTTLSTHTTEAWSSVEEEEDRLILTSSPEFDGLVTATVLAQLGSHAYLPCTIINLADQTVSWIRNKDSHILTVDRYTFIWDDRFTARFDAATQTWTLQIKFVSDSDAGSYECQVSTEPKISRAVKLRIVRPTVTIPGGNELHVRGGSDVTIKCVIAHALQPPPYALWFHESRQLGSQGGRVHRISADTALAALAITRVSSSNAGNYTCAPAALPSASVMVHVLNEEHPAAMQHGKSSSVASARRHAPTVSHYIILVVFTLSWLLPLLCHILQFCFVLSQKFLQLPLLLRVSRKASYLFRYQ
uniref:Hemicentin-2-like n=1 Tax=Hirondellea gigas TaxID=1518452 RepID=A0A6A7GAS1_9CRUS